MQKVNRYSRHEILAGFGSEGQKKVAASKVLVIGAGGLGSSACLYLAGSGVGTVTVADFDSVDETNLQRQIIHKTANVGQSKAQSARQAMLELNPNIAVKALTDQLDEKSLSELVRAHDVVLDCTDNSKSRYITNAVCKALSKPLVTAGAVAYDGQITVLDFRDPHSACYACIFPNREGSDEKASSLGVFAPLVGMLGCMQAGETLKLIVGLGTPLTSRLLMVDALNMTFTTMRYKPNPKCPCCSEKEEK